MPKGVHDITYIVYNDLPNIEDLKHIFPDRYRADPVLVASSRATN